MLHCKIESIPCNPNENRSLPCGRLRFFTSMAEGEARTAWKCAIPARCGWFCGSCAAPYDALSPMEDGGREMTHRHSCSRSIFVGKSLDIILSGDGKIDIIRYNYHVYTSVQSVPPKDFMSGKDANTMKKTHWSVFIRAPVSAASFRDDPAARLGGA